ncbi:hypothetical protein V5F79_22095 [Xanthobacter flavus]|uniref:hypothetical protein n=1 Tax=Xanthobacter flavus TaxID=281 RepID=UPI003727321C
MGRLITVSDLEVRDGEPKVEDIRLAKALGFANIHDIRTLIRRHMEALKAFGEVSVMQRKPGAKGGRPSTVFYLNEEQAIFITAKSDTPKAAEITVEMVRVFRAYLNEQRKPAQVRKRQPPMPGPDLETRLATIEEKIKLIAAAAVTERELYGICMNANIRIENGEEPNHGKALENVMADRVTRSYGGTPSGKALTLLEKDYGKKKPAFPARDAWKREPQWPSHPHVWVREMPEGACPMIDNTKKAEKLPDGSIAMPVIGGGYTILPIQATRKRISA